MKRTLLFSVAAMFAGHMAFAAISTDTITADLLAQGYTRVEIKQGPTQIKVEAVRGTETLELVYDIESGAILKTDTGEVYPGENTTPGVEVSTGGRDFVDGADHADGDKADGHNSGHGHDGAGSGDGDNHDEGDDHGDDNGDDNGDDHGGGSHEGDRSSNDD